MIEYYIWLKECFDIPEKYKRELIQFFGNPKNVYEASILDYPDKFRSNKKWMDSINKKSLVSALNVLEENQKRKIKTMTIDDSIYRAEVSTNENLPILLFYKGSLENPMRRVVSVIGSRKSTEYGKVVAKTICEEYVEKNMVIASGLAAGIDSIVHQSVLDLNGTTYAFTVCGLDSCYPSANEPLMKAIEERGAIISAYPLGVPPRRYHFVQRNELMTLWSDEIVVVEAAAVSGSVKTAEFALKNNLRVFSVPNNIFALSSEGCNDLLDKGAIPYRCGKQSSRKHNNQRVSTARKNLILEMIKVKPLSIQELSEKSRYSIERIQNELIVMELNNLVQFKQDGKWHYISY